MFTYYKSEITLCNYVVYDKKNEIAIEIFIDNKTANNFLIIPIDDKIKHIEVLKDHIADEIKEPILTCNYKTILAYKVSITNSVVSTLKKISSKNTKRENDLLIYTTFEKYNDCHFIIIALPKITSYRLNVLHIITDSCVNIPVYKNIHSKIKNFVNINIINANKKESFKNYNLLTSKRFMKNG